MTRRIRTTFGTTTQYENIWFNEKPGTPFADPNLRAAFSYAFDRQTFLNDIVKPFYPTVQMLNCAVWLPNVGNWCSGGPQPWSDVAARLQHGRPVHGQARATRRTATASGRRVARTLVLKWMANTGNKRREDTQAEFIPLLAKQGFKVQTDNSDDATVFQKRLPAGDYDFSMFIQVTSPDPTVTSILSCDNIPSAANKGQGQNDWWYCNKDADKLMLSSDGELEQADPCAADPAARSDLVQGLHEPAVVRVPRVGVVATGQDHRPDRPVHQQPGKRVLEHVGVVGGIVNPS